MWGDIVHFSDYDPFDRQPRQYLPYTTIGESTKFKTTPMNDQAVYFNTNYGESPAFGQRGFDNSPLDRITNTKAPGQVWAAGAGNAVSYELNDQAADNVQIWSIGDNSTDYPVSLGSYGSNTLFKTKSVDDKGATTIEYTNNAGQLILKKIEINATHATAHDGWICTYNVYNDLGELRYMIQPEAVKYLDGHSWSFAGSDGPQVLKELCYRYEYDEKGLLIVKKVPQAKELYTIYDKRNRIALTQDGNQRMKSTPEWTAILYDELDRPMLTALYATNKTRAALQTDVDNGAGYSPLTPADLSNAAVTTIVKYQYYDNYGFTGAKAFSNDFDNGQAYSSGEPIVATQRTSGMATGAQVRVLNTNIFLASTVYYDDHGRTIQVLEDNIKGGVDVRTSQCQYDGRLLSSNSKHSTQNSGYTSYSILTKNVYNKIGRIISVQKKYGGNDLKSITSYDYDDMGRLKTKHLDPGYTGTGKNELESLGYSYNILNQITGINKDYALKTPGKYDKWGNYFGIYLGYDNKDGVFADYQLDGHITGTVWSTQGDDVQRKYDYSYDKSGRLSSAGFNERQNTGDGWDHSKMDFSVKGRNGDIQYDLNGNLVYLLQKGVAAGSSTPLNVDDLYYEYDQFSNKLLKVTDGGNTSDANGKLGDFKDGSVAGNDYVYDDNGNLVNDLNKNITDLGNVAGASGVRYNYLDKPEEIHIPGKGTVTMVYDGNGNRLQKSFTPEGSPTTTTTTFIDEFVYQGDNVQFINFEEGRIRIVQTVDQDNGYDFLHLDGTIDMPGNKRGVFDFFIRDHQNNIRMILSEETHQGSNSCTMEFARASNEEPLFGQVDANGVPTTDNEVKARFEVNSIPGQMVGNGWTDNTIGSYVSRIGNLAGKKVGPNSLLKVMAGDKVSARTIYYYQNPVVNPGTSTTLVTDILSSLAQAISGGGATSGILHGPMAATNITSQLTGSVPFSIAAEPDGTNASGDNPKAYLTVLFFDERFNFVQEGSTHYRVQQSGNGAAPLIANELLAPKNGYAYVYVSNESDEMVYFDNLQVTNKHSAIIEEDHYYAFGLKIAGISSRKLADPGDGNIDNKDLYNDKELSDEGDLDWYEYGFRNYDVQIGRFPQVDPLTDMYPFLTPFQYAGNEPIANVDLEGLETGGLPTPGGVWNGSFLQQAGSHVGHELTAAQTVATEVVTATNVAAKAIASVAAGQNGPRLIAYSAVNKLLNSDGSPADDSRHEWNPTKDNEDDLRKKMEQLIRDQTSDDPKMQAVALKMMKRFLDNTGGPFSDPDLDDKVAHDDNFKDFENNVMVRINEQLAKVDGDIDKMKDFTIGNPAFNRWANNSDGLGITIHGVSYVEVHLLKFEKHGNRGDYSIQIQIDLYDNFGLGANDLEIENVKQLYKLWGKDKLNAWLKLQHNFDHVPLRTHVTEKIGARMNIHSTYRRH